MERGQLHGKGAKGVACKVGARGGATGQGGCVQTLEPEEELPGGGLQR